MIVRIQIDDHSIEGECVTPKDAAAFIKNFGELVRLFGTEKPFRLVLSKLAGSDEWAPMPMKREEKEAMEQR